MYYNIFCLTMCIAAIISVIGVGMFARHFYGNANESPFGWSFALTIVGLLVFLINGILLVIHVIFIHIYLCSARANIRGRTQSAGIFGCFQDCFEVV